MTNCKTGCNYPAIKIDTNEYTRTISGQTFHDLPDSHDFSKEKDFFHIFAGNYCSGRKVDGKYEADYCSPRGKQFFDLHSLWRVWRVDLIKDDPIGTNPRLIYIGLLVMLAIIILCIVSLTLALCSYWAMLVSTLLSTVSASLLLL
jgi:hypothetical protein